MRDVFKHLIFLLLACLTGCATNSSRKVEFESKLPAKEQLYLNLAVELQTKISEPVWPGFERFKTME